ncbi:diaminopimelate epimerase [Nitrosomonas aestuarii]|uniref:Diaminopimelate epimerase n=1 Tax=Nitrosomonas aestuarii TaxID=52441 RepID=A0A1I4BLV2_9PROT|nr:diaminopimelate epimerase [Nitrosomonas aestuarii]SFK69167.1 diaminopimelate epimerase [Nitrosomonas aestuarii]
MKIKFTKMHGLGNDFVVIDCINQTLSLSRKQLSFIADRHFGIGCDQILMVEKASGNADFFYRIFNADGGEVEQCGNGARCFVRYVHDQGLTLKNPVSVETLSGLITPTLQKNGEVTVDMGIPKFEPAEIPFVADHRALTYSLEVQGKTVQISALSMGNPHAVRIVGDIDKAPVGSEGALIETHPRFPKRVNVGYMQIIDRHNIQLRVFERGAGETLACGTGACAAVVAGVQQNLLDTPVSVNTRGGKLTISWDGENQSVWMTGPAVTVFEGEINL